MLTDLCARRCRETYLRYAIAACQDESTSGRLSDLSIARHCSPKLHGEERLSTPRPRAAQTSLVAPKMSGRGGGGGSGSSSVRRLHVVINPASGGRSAEQILVDEVHPLISNHSAAAGHRVIEYRTQCEGDAARIGREILAAEKECGGGTSRETAILIAALGGDGTTHELLNGLVEVSTEDAPTAKSAIPYADMAIIPTGTANALYASLYAKQYGAEQVGTDRLRSLRALLDGTQKPYALALSAVTLDGADKPPILAHLITSHALHASILADSEALREAHPGLERFKMAFVQNASQWIDASVELLPLPGDAGVQQYSPQHIAFQAAFPANTGTTAARLDGPILYFVCVTTDRLEPAFVPAPFSGPLCDDESLQRPSDAVDIVVVRPTRDPAVAQASAAKPSPATWTEEDAAVRESFVTRVLHRITTDMYQEGKHINLTYADTGSGSAGASDSQEAVEVSGTGRPVCEYFRCAGYRWLPHEPRARRACIDGTVVDANATSVRVLSAKEGAGHIVVSR